MLLPDEKLRSIVLENKLTDEKTLQEIVDYADNSGLPLYSALVERNVVTDTLLGSLIAKTVDLPFINLSKISLPEDTFRIIPQRLAWKHKIVPFARDKDGLKLAMASPGATEVVKMLQKKTGEKVTIYLATENDIKDALSIYKRDLQRSVDNLINEDTGHAQTTVQEDPPMAKVVDNLIEEAYEERASDIHIEPQEKETTVRFRIDGILHDVLKLPKRLHDRVVTRIKVLSNLRTDEHLSAQDGKLRVALEEENMDVRVSILPIADGEKVVLRLLSSRSRAYTLTDLGMDEVDLKKLTTAFSRSYGMILSTGPTGSGKTTSIYAILKILNQKEKNITTVEDPVEYRIKGANQVQVNPKTNLTFASGLRSILRQDPNIIFVGEIRDNETAGIAVNAALTGHLVLSTLHTNDAATAIPRLTDMKVEPYLVASTVNLIVAQRLVRQICEICRTSTTTTTQELLKHFSDETIKKHYIPVGEKKEIRIYRGRGCKACHFTGYSGRVGIFEVLEVTKKIKNLITEKVDADVIAKAAIAEGMKTMLDDGLEKVSKGVTTIEEVIRVTKVESS